MFVCPWENEAFPALQPTLWREPAGRCKRAAPRVQPPFGSTCDGLICATCGRCQRCRAWYPSPDIPAKPTLADALRASLEAHRPGAAL